MQFAYNTKNKNTRWPFPTMHIFEGIQSYSNCGRIKREDERFEFSNKPFHDKLLTPCEHCCHGQRNKLFELLRESS